MDDECLFKFWIQGFLLRIQKNNARGMFLSLIILNYDCHIEAYVYYIYIYHMYIYISMLLYENILYIYIYIFNNVAFNVSLYYYIPICKNQNIAKL